MALINCPECKNKVSDKANACPHCGFPIEEYLNNIKKHGEHKMSMEFDVSVDDNDEKYIKNINGIKVNLGNLLLSKNFEVSSSCKTLCSITKIGIVESKSIIENFIKNFPEFDKEKEFEDFIKNQAQLTHKFKTDHKIGKLCIDYESKLFRLGFWSYIYKFDEIGDVSIGEKDGKVYVEILINNEHIPDIRMNIPNFRNIESIKDLSLKNIIVTKEEAMAKALEIHETILRLKNIE